MKWQTWGIFCVVLVTFVPIPVSAADEAVWKALLRESHSLHRERQYDKAAEMAKQAIEFAETTFGGDDPKVASSLKQLAYVYSYERRYGESVPLLRRALAIIEGHYGPEHQEVARYLSNLAIHLGNSRHRDEAERLYERALAIREKVLGPDHLDLAYNLISLGNYARQRGDYERAEALLTRALGIRKKHLKPDHGWIAESWTFLAGLYENQGRYDEAVAAQRRAVEIKVRKHGAGHHLVVGYEKTLARLEKGAAKYGNSTGRAAAGRPGSLRMAAGSERSRKSPAVAQTGRSLRSAGGEPVPAKRPQRPATRSVSTGRPSPALPVRGRDKRETRPVDDFDSLVKTAEAQLDRFKREISGMDWGGIIVFLIVAGFVVRAVVQAIRKASVRDKSVTVQDMNPHRRRW